MQKIFPVFMFIFMLQYLVSLKILCFVQVNQVHVSGESLFVQMGLNVFVFECVCLVGMHISVTQWKNVTARWRNGIMRRQWNL